MEEIYSLYPVEVDGHIHFVFRESVASSDFQKDPNSTLESVSAMLQYRTLRFMEACARHDAGNLTDEEYALWKSKFPEYWDDFHKVIQADEDKTAGGPLWACQRFLYSVGEEQHYSHSISFCKSFFFEPFFGLAVLAGILSSQYSNMV